MIKVQILGPLRVEDDEGPRPVDSFTQQRLLARLAIAGSAGVDTGVLCDDLDLSPAALRTAVWRLRKALGGFVMTQRATYALVDVELDADRFEQELAAAPPVDVAERIAALEGSLAYWRGAALDRFRAEPWAQPVAVRLEELRAATQESTAEAKLLLGNHVEVIAAARSLITDHPLRDRPRGLLMEALAGAGRRTEALRVFYDYRTLLIDEIGTEPGQDLRRLDADIAAGVDEFEILEGGRGDGPGNDPVRRRAGGLPRTSTTFVGRRLDREAIGAHLKASRIVTLTGSGGVGKTRLAVEVGRELQREWMSGVRFVDLTKAGRDDDVLAVVRTALGVSAAGAMPVEEVVEVIMADDLLLILDNCEHVIGEVAALVEVIEEACPGITVLATSREALGVPGERIHTLGPLPTPGDALQLFADRAAAVDQAFRFDDTTRPIIEEICRTLDGIPLAIELAAARMRSLALQDIADRLDDRFRLLSGVRRTTVDRHRTLTAALDWSFGLLSETERQVLLWLGTFVQPFSLTDAEGVLDDTTSAETLAALVDKSMLTQSHGTYRLLETIRLYCLDHLTKRGQLDDARADHAAYVLAEMRLAVARVHGEESVGGAKRAYTLFAELRAAARWAAESDRLDLAMDLCDAVESVFILDIDLGALATDVDVHRDSRRHTRSLLIEGFELNGRQLRGAPVPIDRIRQLVDRFLAGEQSSTVAAFGPMALSYRGHDAEAVEAAERVRSLCLALPDGPPSRYSLQASAYLTAEPEHVAQLRQGLAVARAERSDYWIGSVGVSLAYILSDVNPTEAREIVLSCVGSASEVGMPLLVQASLLLFAMLVTLEDAPDPLEPRVVAVLAQEIDQARLGHRLRGHHFFALGALLAAAGNHDLAAQSLAAHDAIATPSSARTRVKIEAARTNIDAQLADAGVQPGPPPAPADLSALASRIADALLLVGKRPGTRRRPTTGN